MVMLPPELHNSYNLHFMQHKKIAIVANSTWNIYNFRQELIKLLKHEQYKIIVIAPVDEYIHYLNGTYFTKHIALQHLNAQSGNPIQDLRLIYELYKIYKEEKPDLVIHFTIKPNIYGSIAARLLKIKSISNVTGLGYTFVNQNKLSILLLNLYRFAFKSCHTVVFHNNEDAALFKQLQIVTAEQIKVIEGSGVNTDFFHPRENKKHSHFTFLFVGRLLKDKGVQEFVHAVKRCRPIIKNAEFWMVGQLNENNPGSIKKIDLLNWVDQRIIKYFGADKNIKHYLSQADVLVLPSYREGMPKAVLEAMAMGKVIITTDVAGCRDTVVHGKNGFLVPAKDDVSLSELMVKLYQLSDEEIQKMGDMSRDIAEQRFDIKIILSQFLEMVNHCLNEDFKNTNTISIPKESIFE